MRVQCNYQFYAGAPIISPGGYPIGSLCIIDNNPRYDFGIYLFTYFCVILLSLFVVVGFFYFILYFLYRSGKTKTIGSFGI